MNYEGVYRTAPATPGLLIMYTMWGHTMLTMITRGDVVQTNTQITEGEWGFESGQYLIM